MKLCKDCKWRGRLLLRCWAPQNLIVEPVNGDTKHIVQWCDNQRGIESEITCGPTGKWWEPKK